MRVDLVTLFPEMFQGFLGTSFMGRAIEQSLLRTRFRSPRLHGKGRHQSVDDTPYGGGSGMVMRADVIVETMEALDGLCTSDEPRAHRILLTPQGRVFDQTAARRLAGHDAIMFVCGRYEGFDERIRLFVDEELSIGDFVMTGGEVAAMAMIDAIVRLLPGVLGNAHSAREESHSPEQFGLLEYPQYTRPQSFRELDVPAVLTSGDHARIRAFRMAESLERTARKRQDLHARALGRLFAAQSEEEE